MKLICQKYNSDKWHILCCTKQGQEETNVYKNKKQKALQAREKYDSKGVEMNEEWNKYKIWHILVQRE